MDENSTGHANTDASSDDVLRELALRLLASHFPRLTGTDAEPQLLVGALPPHLPFALPLPEDALLLGSFIGGGSGDPVVAIDSALAPEDALDWYRRRLTEAGWSEEQMPVHPGGFQPSRDDRPAMATFYQSDDGPMLRILCWHAPAGRTTIQAYVVAAPAQPAHIRQRHMVGRERMRLLPWLSAPAGATQQGGGGGGAGDDHVFTHSYLDTNLDVLALAAHYHAELERAGWQPGDSGASGPVAWSTWTVRDHDGEPWNGLFIALHLPNRPQRYQLLLEADYAGTSTRDDGRPSGGGTGWTSYGPLTRH
ncbi:MAG: hypothetical protein ACHQ4H_06260 [Ktedonobacterales bacterium]